MSRVPRALRGIPPSTTLPPPSAEMKNSSNCPRSDKKSVQGMHLNATKGKQRGAVKIQNHTLGKPTALASTLSEFLLQGSTFCATACWGQHLRPKSQKNTALVSLKEMCFVNKAHERKRERKWQLNTLKHKHTDYETLRSGKIITVIIWTHTYISTSLWWAQSSLHCLKWHFTALQEVTQVLLKYTGTLGKAKALQTSLGTSE